MSNWYILGVMAISVSFNLLAALVFLFLFWRKMREDYTANQIFTTAIYAILGGALGVGIAFKFVFVWWFWPLMIGVFLGFGVGVWRFHLRFYETLDALIFSLLPWLAVFFLSDSIVNLKLSSLIASALVFGLVGLYWYLDNHYKNFSWYRSGKVGFAGLTTAAAFFLVRAALAIPFGYVLSFSGKFEALISAITAFIFFLLIFNLSRQV